MNGKIIKLSPTSLNLFRDCPRCFWLQVNKGIRPPEKYPPAMQLGIDRALKAYYDYFRGKRDLPPLLEGKIKGKLLADQELVDQLRGSGFGFMIDELGVWFNGRLDDALELPDGSIIPIDNKSHGFAPKETYQHYIYQLGAYTLILMKNGHKTKRIGYLIHFFLNHDEMDIDNPLVHKITTEEIITHPEKVEELLVRAVEVIRGPLPQPDPGCVFCRYKGLDFSGF